MKHFRPTSSGMRRKTVSSFNEITRTTPEKSLTRKLFKKAGRNNQGRITVRHRGGGEKRKYRLIDFKRNKDNIIGNVMSIEYDPNRSTYISLISYLDGEKKYILTPKGLKVGDKIMSGDKAEIKIGNTLFLKDIIVGSIIHNIEIRPKKGGQLVRSAGTSAQLLAKENGKAQIKLPCGEVRIFSVKCRATIGEVSNSSHSNLVIGKAGRKRHLGIRPTVRGIAMNPNDHPHGGGEGKSPIGRKRPVTPWGKPALGVKTRRKNRYSDNCIFRRRYKNKK